MQEVGRDSKRNMNQKQAKVGKKTKLNTPSRLDNDPTISLKPNNTKTQG